MSGLNGWQILHCSYSIPGRQINSRFEKIQKKVTQRTQHREIDQLVLSQMLEEKWKPGSNQPWMKRNQTLLKQPPSLYNFKNELPGSCRNVLDDGKITPNKKRKKNENEDAEQPTAHWVTIDEKLFFTVTENIVPGFSVVVDCKKKIAWGNYQRLTGFHSSYPTKKLSR